MENNRMNDMIEFILKNKKVCIISLVSLLMFLVILVANLNSKDGTSSLENNQTIPVVLEDNKIFSLLEGTVVSVKVPKDVIYRSLVAFVEDNKIEGIEDLSVLLNSNGITLKAKYSLMNFIKIPAEFTLVPSKLGSTLTLSVENVKIMNLKIKIDKIIEKWITANEEIKEIVTYTDGKIQVDISKVAPIAIDDISLEDGIINLSIKIIKETLK